jgi:8-oxo-dGTP pyrophosphatase MutT (NUDIX family)
MVKAIPSATVAPLRDGADGLEVLLLRRNAKLEFVGGAWVFPGGRIDPEDFEHNGSTELDAAHRAAVRECREEADLVVDEKELICISHWTTPEAAPKRFSTWFFLTSANCGRQVVVDGGEIHGYQWVRPSAAIEQYHAGEILIILPTYRTLELLLEYQTVAMVMDAHKGKDPVIMPVSASVMEVP